MHYHVDQTFQKNEKENTDTTTDKVSYYKKVVSPSDDEIKKHKEYLKLNLKKNYFN